MGETAQKNDVCGKINAYRVFKNALKLYSDLDFAFKISRKDKKKVVWSRSDRCVSWCANPRPDDVILWDPGGLLPDPLGIYDNEPDIRISASTIYEFDREGFEAFIFSETNIMSD